MKLTNSSLHPLGLGFRLLLALLLLGPGPLFAASPSVGSPDEYPHLLIGIGDFLTVTVVGYQRAGTMATGPSAFSNNDNNIDLPRDFLVDSDGKILFPFIGEVKVTGLTQTAASKLLMERLAKYVKFPQVTVLIRESNSYNVSVLGQVLHPGKFLIRGNPTLMSILSESGGPLENADLGGAMLIHNGKKTSINLHDFLLNKNFEARDLPVFPGDILVVPKSGWPTAGEWAIIASILTSGVVIYSALKK